MQKYRISTNIGVDNKVVFELKQDYDLLEILSLKFTQSEVYSSMCADYGVVCGRVSVNNGFGVPNIRVSIFIPIQDEDVDDPVISALYPYTTVDDKNEEGYRYNLLPARRQHGGHAPTGTFPDQTDILTREEVLEVYEKYYKYTAKTNSAGDFMIWGVPVGSQTIHVEADLSDISCFSLRPDDFIRQGMGVDKFKNSYEFKSSNDLDSLPQIVSFNQTIEVYPFWGNQDLCEIGITRSDFDLSSRGVKIEPKAYLLGSVYSDQGTISVNKNCRPRGKMGRKCDLTTFGCNVEIIRFNNLKDSKGRPGLEFYEFQENVDDDGSFVIPLPMNLDYVFTNEFGENEITNDPNKGIPTSACYRFRISPKDQGTDSTSLFGSKTLGSYLIPNIREYTDNIDKSYAWSLNWDDYPNEALNNDDTKGIFYNVFGSYYPRDYFYRFTYNKVYAVSSFMGVHQSKGIFSGRDNFLGLKEIAPKDDEDCQSEVSTPPTNWGFRKFTFGILLALVISFFEKLMYFAFLFVVQVLIVPFQILYSFRIGPYDVGFFTIDIRPFGMFDRIIENLQNFGTLTLGTVTFPECETCADGATTTPSLDPANLGTDPSTLYEKVGEGVAVRDTVKVTIDCELIQLNPPTTSGTTTFTFTDCATNSLSATTLNSGSTVVSACTIPLTMVVTQSNGGDGTAVGVGGCDQTITYTPIIDFDPLTSGFWLSDEYSPYQPPITSYTALTVSAVTYTLSYIYDKQNNRDFYIKLKSYLPHSGATTIEKNKVLGLTTGTSTNSKISYFTPPPPIATGYTKSLTDINPQFDPDADFQPWILYRDENNNDYGWTGFTYEIYDSKLKKPPTQTSSFTTSSLPSGCSSRNKVYNDNIVYASYCDTDVNNYSTALYTNSCPGGTFIIGQSVLKDSDNRCKSCRTRSGFSELRNGVYTVIPAAGFANWGPNSDLLDEYIRTKLINKLFCEGLVSYSFIDNWLTGSLYMFPFKAKVRWDNEDELDLNFRWTKYCNNLVYFKVAETATNSPVKRFYYRSTKFDGNFKRYDGFDNDFGTLAHPTTIVDLGPRDEFIKEICVDPTLDPNCSVVRNVKSTSFQNFKELLGLYINYRLDVENDQYTYKEFFSNNGFDFNTGNKLVLNGDVLQLISINNESGIEEFDLQNKNYGAYSPSILTASNYPQLLSGGTLPINFVLDSDGIRVRSCLNEPGRLTESSQRVPFFLWDKGGSGFGSGVSQSWNYPPVGNPVFNRDLQGMTYNYAFTGDTTYNYVLFPMTLTYNGNLISVGGDLNDVGFDIEEITDNHTLYNNQEEGFTYLYVTGYTGTFGTSTFTPTAGLLYTRVGNAGNWNSKTWTNSVTYIIKPTQNNYTGNQQILSTPFLFYFGLRPGRTAVDKFIARFGPAGIFPTAE